MTTDDPTRRSFWRPLRRVQLALDEEIADVYRRHGVTGVRPRFAYPLIRLWHVGPMTLRELAESLDQTHSAVSQTIGAMRRAGLVDTAPGPDARTRVVDLTERAQALVPFLDAEWRATEDAMAELDAELPFRLADYLEALTERLDERSFADRVAARLRDRQPTRE